MKVTISLHDLIQVQLTYLGALIYNDHQTKGISQEEMDAYYASTHCKKEGDILEGNLHSILSLFSTSNGDILLDCFQGEAFHMSGFFNFPPKEEKNINV